MLLPIAALIFLTVFCALIAVALFLAERQASPRTELKRRLHRMTEGRMREVPEELKAAMNRELSRADRFLASFSVTRDLERRLDRAGFDVSAATFLAATAAAAVALSAAVAARTGMFLLALPAAAAVLLAAALLLRVTTERRIAGFTEHFPDALAMISRSLRAGHSFATAIQLVGQELPPPVGPLFKTAYEQQQLGLRTAEALMNINDRIDSLDLRFFTTVVAINTDVGGNLADVLDKLAATIRDRLRIRRQVKVYTAQGRMSGYVLGVLPALVFAVFGVMNPDYETALLKDPLGVKILILAAVMQLVGLMTIRKIIRIKI